VLESIGLKSGRKKLVKRGVDLVGRVKNEGNLQSRGAFSEVRGGRSPVGGLGGSSSSVFKKIQKVISPPTKATRSS